MLTSKKKNKIIIFCFLIIFLIIFLLPTIASAVIGVDEQGLSITTNKSSINMGEKAQITASMYHLSSTTVHFSSSPVGVFSPRSSCGTPNNDGSCSVDFSGTAGTYQINAWVEYADDSTTQANPITITVSPTIRLSAQKTTLNKGDEAQISAVLSDQKGGVLVYFAVNPQDGATLTPTHCTTNSTGCNIKFSSSVEGTYMIGVSATNPDTGIDYVHINTAVPLSFHVLADNEGPGLTTKTLYYPLAHIPGIGEEDCEEVKINGEWSRNCVDTTPESGGFGKYLGALIKIFIGLCAVLAMIMIVMGGIQYMTSELVSGKAAGKETIMQAILGLLLALGAFAILNTLNPKLLDISLKNLPKAEIIIDAENGYIDGTDDELYEMTKATCDPSTNEATNVTLIDGISGVLLNKICKRDPAPPNTSLIGGTQTWEHGNRSSTQFIVLHRTTGSKAFGSWAWWVNPWDKQRQTYLDAGGNDRRGIAAHFIVDNDGQIWQTVSLEKKAWHVSNNNHNSIGIEVTGDHDEEKSWDSTCNWEPVTESQKIATANLVKRLQAKYNLNNNAIKVHEELESKTAGEGQVVFDAIKPALGMTVSGNPCASTGGSVEHLVAVDFRYNANKFVFNIENGNSQGVYAYNIYNNGVIVGEQFRSLPLKHESGNLFVSDPAISGPQYNILQPLGELTFYVYGPSGTVGLIDKNI